MSKNVRLIGICGSAKAGKNTFAKSATSILINTTNEEYSDFIIAQESFAAPIKSMVAMLLDFFGFGSIMNPTSLEPYIEGDLKEEELKSIGVSPRKLMQTLGTDWGRDTISNTIWIDSMKQRIDMYAEAEKHGHKGAFVLITDVRFDNEAHMIKEKGGTIVKVVTKREHEEVIPHASEQGISDFLVDTVIENDGSPEEFKEQTLAYLEGLLGTDLNKIEAPIIHIPPTDKGDEGA